MAGEQFGPIGGGSSGGGSSSLTTLSGSLSTPTTLTKLTSVTGMSLAGFVAGTYIVHVTGLVVINIAANEGVDIRLTQGSSTSTITGAASTSIPPIDSALAITEEIGFGLTAKVVCTVAGTLTLLCFNNDSGQNATLESASQQGQAYAGATGWTAIKTA